MKIMKIIMLLMFLIAIISILAPVNATLQCTLSADSEKTVNGRTPITLVVGSDIYDKTSDNQDKTLPQRKAELNKAHRISLDIKGYKTISFKKPAKGWKYENGMYEGFVKSFSVKGNAFNKDYTIKCYDKKGKLIKAKYNKGKVTPDPRLLENSKPKFESYQILYHKHTHNTGPLCAANPGEKCPNTGKTDVTAVMKGKVNDLKKYSHGRVKLDNKVISKTQSYKSMTERGSDGFVIRALKSGTNSLNEKNLKFEGYNKQTKKWDLLGVHVIIKDNFSLKHGYY